MDISLKEIQDATGGTVLSSAASDLVVRKVSTDTRTIEKGDLFFALIGPNFDGHDFIKDAYEKGARTFVVSDEKKVPAAVKTTTNLIHVEDTLKAYGDLAKLYRQKFKIPAVAITGSSGKTTLKEMTAHILGAKFKVLKNRGTENNLVGVPKTIFQLEESHEILVLEMGTNAPGEIERLASIVAPQIGVVTQIGLSHLEGLKTREGVKEEKLKILTHLERGGILVLNGEDELLKDVQSGVHKIIRAGFGKEGEEWAADQVWCHEKGSSFHLKGEIFETQLLGRHNVLNCVLAVSVAGLLGMEFSAIQKALASFKPVSGRLYSKELAGIIFLDDTYNANPTSLRAALETLKDMKLRERKGVVCGDMLELGAQNETLHREAGKQIAAMLFDFVIAAGPSCKFLVEEALKCGFDPTRIHHVKDSVEAGKVCRQIAKEGDRILVKGSRGMKMEKVFECFTTSSTR